MAEDVKDEIAAALAASLKRAKPAKVKEPAKPAVKPATSKPANAIKKQVEGIGVEDVAARVGVTPKSLRTTIRRMFGGPQVGKGSRYNWKNWSDPQVKQILAAYAKGGSKGTVAAKAKAPKKSAKRGKVTVSA